MSKKADNTLATQDHQAEELFHNPYHFVPVPEESREYWEEKEIFFKDTGAHWTHSRYITEEGVHNGRIVCRLTTETPIFIGSKRESEATEKSPAVVAPFELVKGKPAIPASSLRGLISSIAEAASNSSMRVLENRRLSMRQNHTTPLPAIGMMHITGDKEEEKKQYRLYPLAPPDRRARGVHDRFEKFFGNVKPPELVRLHSSCDTCGQELETYSKKNPKRYYLIKEDFTLIPEKVASEDVKKKGTLGIVRYFPFKVGHVRRHYFFPFPHHVEGMKDSKSYLVPEEVVEVFHQLADQRTEAEKKGILPNIPKNTERNSGDAPGEKHVRLKTGDIVFFDVDENKNISEISFSAIWRKVAGGTVFDFFSSKENGYKDLEILPFHGKREFVSPAEMVFGFVEDRDKKDKITEPAKAYAGRVRFSHGIFEGEVQKAYQKDGVMLKILDSPKPPCPAMYFTQRTGKTAYISKADLKVEEHCPQGRKMYLHHPYQEGANPWKTQKPKENLKQKVCITPVAKGQSFWFHIDFTNLDDYELGMLLYSLKPDENFRHKIGMGKPIGLGTVNIEPVFLQLIDRKARYTEKPLSSSRRYSKIFCLLPDKSETDKLENVPTRYREDNMKEFCLKEKAQNLDAWKVFKGSMKDSVHDALILLGNPAMVRHSVHTPLQKGQAEEEETFKWFGKNDRIGLEDKKRKRAPQQAQFLKPLGNAGALEPLKKN